MNKLLLLTVVVFFIIGGILFSASVISEDNNKSQAGDNFAIQAVSETRRDIRNVNELVSKHEADYQETSARINSVEQRLLVVENLIGNPNYSSATNVNQNSSAKQLTCEITGYTNPDNSPVSASQSESVSLNEQFQRGTKKVQMLCSY